MKHCYTRILLSLVFLLGSLSVYILPLKAEETEVPDDYTLEEVVILSRHNIRAPLSTEGSAVSTGSPVGSSTGSGSVTSSPPVGSSLGSGSSTGSSAGSSVGSSFGALVCTT